MCGLVDMLGPVYTVCPTLSLLLVCTIHCTGLTCYPASHCAFTTETWSQITVDLCLSASSTLVVRHYFTCVAFDLSTLLSRVYSRDVVLSREHSRPILCVLVFCLERRVLDTYGLCLDLGLEESISNIFKTFIEVLRDKPVSYTHLTLPTKRIV